MTESEKRLRSGISRSVAKNGQRVESPVILVPTATEMADFLGVSKATLYRGGVTYDERVEAVTGLHVIHHGLVVGTKNDSDNDHGRSPLDLIASASEHLTRAEITELIGNLVTRLA